MRRGGGGFLSDSFLVKKREAVSVFDKVFMCQLKQEFKLMEYFLVDREFTDNLSVL